MRRYAAVPVSFASAPLMRIVKSLELKRPR